MQNAGRATAMLRQEHDSILRMLDATEKVARQLDRGQHVTPQTLTELLEFFHLFADRFHHAKEEELVFPLLEERGLPCGGGCLGVMLAEHEQGRSLVEQMAEAASAYSKGAAEAGRRWAEAAWHYAALLRNHINREETVLFVTAENLLTDSEQSALAHAFGELEEQKMDAGTHERMHALMDKLTAAVASKR